ncbi:SDR family NAD(P)-dependent oxidoreductase [Citrifermentans bremense]|uniref:SDR family NAD(P)-dependent oxidoreductase n=1 Tax=Citrifermentans bremense TaxID=60035 RepID=UPI000686F835|nr:SDR family oxidoreductase [Citrifermentans bremense]
MGGAEHFMVVGGTRGIGKVLVERLVQRGDTVTVLTRKPGGNKPVEGVFYFRADLAVPDELPGRCAELVSSAGKPDHMVCLQRYREQGDDWSGEFAVSVTSNKVLLDFFAGNCTANGKNSVVLANSIAASHVVETQPLSYHTAKAAVDQMIRYYAVRLGPLGIRVNGVAPGTVLKPESRHHFLENPSLQQLYREMTPLRRMGTASEVSDVIEFLTGPNSSFLTGQTLIVDGGLSLQWQESLSLRLTAAQPQQGQ